MSDTYALAAWRMIEHAWRTDGTLAALAEGFRPDGCSDAPRLTVSDTGRLDRLDQVRAVRVNDDVRLSLPLAILDVWIDIDDLAEALIEAVERAAAPPPKGGDPACDNLDYS